MLPATGTTGVLQVRREDEMKWNKLKGVWETGNPGRRWERAEV